MTSRQEARQEALEAAWQRRRAAILAYRSDPTPTREAVRQEARDAYEDAVHAGCWGGHWSRVGPAGMIGDVVEG